MEGVWCDVNLCGGVEGVDVWWGGHSPVVLLEGTEEGCEFWSGRWWIVGGFVGGVEAGFVE